MATPKRGLVFRQVDRLFRDGTLVGLGDRQLLDRYLTRRDEAAFEALVNLHGPMVLGLCRRTLRDPRDIEDAFQATFLIFVRKASSIRDRGLLSNWLYGVAYRVATRARAETLRRRGREIAVAHLEAAADPDYPNLQEIVQALDQELSRLPGKYRAPIVLCYLRGQTHDQAAEELCCPVGTVRSRLARGRDLLKRRLTKRGCAPSVAVIGPGSALPAKLLTGSVPPALAATTVEAAFSAGAFQTMCAGAAAASALALTQGVLTSMKLAQLDGSDLPS
jgi:RNA polymerase sigma factor (sigma-70 family)